MADGFPRKVAAWKAANPPPLLDVWAENWKAVLLFGRALRRQCWRFSFGGPVALDFNLVKMEAKRAGIKMSLQRWADIETMEAEALRQIADSRKK